MRTAASVGMVLVAAGVLVFLVVPLATFFIEFFEDPQVFEVETQSIIIRDTAYFNVTIRYNGNVKLTDFKYIFMIGDNNFTATKQYLSRGDELVLSFNLPIEELDSNETGYVMSFKIIGIYEFTVGVKDGS